MAAKKRMKANKKRRAAKLRRDMLMALDFPAETDPKTFKLTVISTSDLLLENHTGILQCTDSLICLTTCEGAVKIGGGGLILKELALGRAYVSGKIESVTFVE